MYVILLIPQSQNWCWPAELKACAKGVVFSQRIRLKSAGHYRLRAPLLLDDRGNACRHHVVRKVFRHNTSRSDNAAAADSNPLEYGHVRAKPAVIAYNNRQSPLETQVAVLCL